MAQHDQNIANADGATVRADINNALAALFTNSSGATAPSTTVAHQFWVDTTTGTLKRRNAANTGWIVMRTIDESFVLSRSSNTMFDVSDVGKTLIATSTFTQTFDAAATLGDGWFIHYRNDGTGVITFDPNGSETIDGVTTKKVYPGESGSIHCNGTALYTTGSKAQANTKIGSFSRDTTTASGTQAITGVGFKPSAVIFFSNINTTTAVSVGMDNTTTTTNYFGTGSGNFAGSGSASITGYVSGGNTYDGKITSMDDDGFTITWTKTGSPTGTLSCLYLAIR